MPEPLPLGEHLVDDRAQRSEADAAADDQRVGSLGRGDRPAHAERALGPRPSSRGGGRTAHGSWRRRRGSCARTSRPGPGHALTEIGTSPAPKA